MMYAKLELNPAWNTYTCTDASDTKMIILGNLLADDIRDNVFSYQQTLTDRSLRGQGGNFVFLEKENEHVILSDLYSEEAIPTEFKIHQQSFVHLLDEWQEKVCKHKPQEVIITHDNNQFTIETKN